MVVYLQPLLFGPMTVDGHHPIYGNNPSKIFISGTKRLVTLGLGMKHCGFWLNNVCSNDTMLTYVFKKPQGQLKSNLM